VADEVARLRGGGAVKSEWRFRRKDGSIFHGEVHGRQLADDPLRSELTPVRDAGQRAALLTRQLLLFSRKAVLEPRVLNCGDVVQRTSQMLRRLISEEIEVSILLAPALDRVKADPSQIEQVIMNLSLNACDAMPRVTPVTLATKVREVLDRGSG
jgi:signal transduction histidine kinase